MQRLKTYESKEGLCLKDINDDMNYKNGVAGKKSSNTVLY